MQSEKMKCKICGKLVHILDIRQHIGTNHLKDATMLTFLTIR